MKKFILLFTSSAKEFKNLNSVITAALLVAVHTILAMVVSVQVTTSLRISLSFITNVVTGCLFGPVIGFVCGGIGDIVQFILKPVGDYFPGWTLNAAMAGMIYGIFFYNKFPDKVNVKKISSKRLSKKDKEHVNTNDLEEDKMKKEPFDRVLDIFSILLPSIGLLCLCFAPMATVIDKNSGSVIAQGNGLYYIMSGLTDNSKNVTIIAIILLVLMVCLVVLSLFHFNIISLILSVACTFAAILAVYTDKKTTIGNWGFYCVVGLMILFVIVKMIMLQRKHAVDMSYFIRVAICLTFDTILVNILMGTYWTSIMYGKGFLFYFTVRMAKNLIQLPINIVLSYYILSVVKGLRLRSSKG